MSTKPRANVESAGVKCPTCGKKRWVSLWWGWTQCKYCGREHPSCVASTREEG